ncbi:DUF2147 domain-containing protein [Spirosoma knui]
MYPLVMYRFRPALLLLLVAILTSSFSPKSDNPDAVVGKWLSSKKKNQVQIYRQGTSYHGKLVWMQEPNDPSTNRPKADGKNPDEKLRTRPLINMLIMTDLRYKGNNVWGDGLIYNPEDGKTYGCQVTLKDANTLDVHGYVFGISMLGKTRTWTRVK